MEIVFYRSLAGAVPVRDYLLELELLERDRINAALEKLREYGVDGGVVQLRRIEGKLWEVKVSRHRIFYVLLTREQMVLLHAYKKQGQKAPLREIDVAKARMKEVLKHQT